MRAGFAILATCAWKYWAVCIQINCLKLTHAQRPHICFVEKIAARESQWLTIILGFNTVFRFSDRTVNRTYTKRLFQLEWNGKDMRQGSGHGVGLWHFGWDQDHSWFIKKHDSQLCLEVMAIVAQC